MSDSAADVPSPYTVLIVDDEKAARGLLRDLLESEHLNVLEAEDGAHALALLESHQVDLLITDRAMPEMGGLELLKELQRTGRILPAIVVSGFGEEALWGEAIALGAKDYLVKPFKAETVRALVKKNLPGGKAA